MIGVRFKSSGSIDKLEKSVKKLITDIQNKTYNTARSLTPVDTGYAKSQWKKKRKSNGFEVYNNVDYVPFLDRGHSKQAPKGITKPTVRIMAGYIKSRRLKR
tara:strand:+ start:2261 stop:2566 length:306 start_codon:yes stop_codon:yes gene_type:complete